MARIPHRLRKIAASSASVAALAGIGVISVDAVDAAAITIVVNPARDNPAGELARLRTLADAGGRGAASRASAQERRVQTARRRARAADARERAAQAVQQRRAREQAAATPQPALGTSAQATGSAPYPYAGAQRANEWSGGAPTLSGGLAGELDTYLTQRGSPLAGLGTVFVSAAANVSIDPRLLVAISGAETSFATYRPAQAIRNPFGLGPNITYPGYEAAIVAAAENLGGRLYKGDGRFTIATIQPRWAPSGASNDPTNLNSNWVRNVSRYYAEQGGNPAASVFGDVSAGGPSVVMAQAASVTRAAPVAYGPAAEVVGGGSGAGPAAARDALSFLGVPYLWGGTTPAGFDCSGLVQYVYARQGVKLPRVAEAQGRVGIPIPPEQLQPGDAIFFADETGYIDHEGLYLGGGSFVQAPHTGDVVKISSMYDPYYASRYAGARRY
ncbi:MAG: C40 family peptidase [Actinobacteria bacterium]|nr:C40 family peptidase [Actinomycetota bacterium]